MARSKLLPAVLVLLLGAALFLRLWSLNDAPPWLWWDEASQGLDGRDVIQGHFRVFFTRAEGKEPFYVYLTVPFVAAFDGAPFAVRLAGALCGAAMVPALYAAGRALWRAQPAAGAWAGVLAAAFWTTNFWPQSINRIGFQVNTLPLMLTLAVVAWLNWTYRPLRGRALFFGFLAGLALYTYLAARITPLLWLALLVALPAAQRRALRPTAGWALLAFLLTATPLLLHFALHPNEAIQRVGGFATFYQAPDTGDQVTLLTDSFVQVAGGFLGFAGDPIPRHNIPNRPPFSLPLAALFAGGFLLALPGLLRRSVRSWTLLLWLSILAFPAFVSANSNPHFPRLLGALPSAFLIAAWPVAWASTEFRTVHHSGLARQVLLIACTLLVLFEAGRNIPAYFVTWARDPALATWYQGEVWQMADRIQQPPRDLGVAPMDPSSALTLDYAFAGAPILTTQVGPEIERWLQAAVAQYAGKIVSTPVWEVEPYVSADAQQAIPFYLAREGILTDENHEPGYVLLDYALGARPQFTASGSTTASEAGFGPGLTLVGARWGGAYPNADRNAVQTAAGTSAWAILDWRLDAPMPGLRGAVDLVDAAGHRLVTVEQPLMSEAAPLTALPPDGILRTYHLIEVPITQPPGEIGIEARAYDATSGEVRLPDNGTPRNSRALGALEVTSPPDTTAGDVSFAVPLEGALGTGLSIVGRDAWPETATPGEEIAFRIFYHADAALDADRTLSVALAGAPVGAVTLPRTSVPGRVSQAFVDLQVPTDLLSGEYALSLSTEAGAPAPLGALIVAGRPAVFESPELTQPVAGRFGDAVQLLGIADAPDLLVAAPGETITLTLVWRALSPSADELVRFVHALGPDGNPPAQRDAAPCDGSCPATSWRPDEILTDRVTIAIPADAPPGEYPLAVGWYESASGTRLAAHDAVDARLPNDILPLPVRLAVRPAEDGP